MDKLPMKIDNVFATVFYYSLGILFIAIIFFPEDFVTPNVYHFILLLLVVILGLQLIGCSCPIPEAPIEYEYIDDVKMENYA